MRGIINALRTDSAARTAIVHISICDIGFAPICCIVVAVGVPTDSLLGSLQSCENRITRSSNSLQKLAFIRLVQCRFIERFPVAVIGLGGLDHLGTVILLLRR